MAIAQNLRNYLHSQDINFDVVFHPHCDSAFNSAKAAHIDLGQLAKAVMLHNADHDRIIMAIVPANRQLQLRAISDLMYDHYELLSSKDIAAIFNDCSAGVVPSLGSAYDIEMIVDANSLGGGDVFIEAGDHESLIRLKQEDFQSLVMGSRHASIAGRWLGEKSASPASHPVFA